jgi:ATP-dependent exoDNAse (exonuclease V) alpha subunit
LARWEQRADGIVCENVHRLKGLEADTVILVADTPEVPDHLLYVGISRAVNELVVIAPAGVGERLGLA